MDTLRITHATPDHYAGMYYVFDAVAHEERYLAFTRATPFEDSLAYYRSIECLGLPHFVALDDGIVVGSIDITTVAGDARSHVGVVGIAILPGYRERGLGTRLLEQAVDAAWAFGLTRLELCVRADNLRAIALYQRFGFQIEGTRRGANRIRGEYFDAHLMGLLRDQPAPVSTPAQNAPGQTAP